MQVLSEIRVKIQFSFLYFILKSTDIKLFKTAPNLVQAINCKTPQVQKVMRSKNPFNSISLSLELGWRLVTHEMTMMLTYKQIINLSYNFESGSPAIQIDFLLEFLQIFS